VGAVAPAPAEPERFDEFALPFWGGRDWRDGPRGRTSAGVGTNYPEPHSSKRTSGLKDLAGLLAVTAAAQARAQPCAASGRAAGVAQTSVVGSGAAPPISWSDDGSRDRLLPRIDVLAVGSSTGGPQALAGCSTGYGRRRHVRS
jgi:hypothetical protein